jgi:hypothetical protein
MAVFYSERDKRKTKRLDPWDIDQVIGLAQARPAFSKRLAFPSAPAHIIF